MAGPELLRKLIGLGTVQQMALAGVDLLDSDDISAAAVLSGPGTASLETSASGDDVTVAGVSWRPHADTFGTTPASVEVPYAARLHAKSHKRTLADFLSVTDASDPAHTRVETGLRMAKFASRSPVAITRIGDEKSFALRRPGKLEIAARTHFGTPLKKPNEDAFAIVCLANGKRYNITADGVGGSVSGDLASRHYVASVASGLRAGMDLTAAVNAAAFSFRQLLAADTDHDILLPDELPRTTLLISEYGFDPVKGTPTVRFHHVGDSRAVVFKTQERAHVPQVVMRTRDHSWVQRVREATATLITTRTEFDGPAQAAHQYAVAEISTFANLIKKYKGDDPDSVNTLGSLIARLERHTRPGQDVVALHPQTDAELIRELQRCGLLILSDEEQRKHPLAVLIDAFVGIDGPQLLGGGHEMDHSELLKLQSGNVIIEASDGLWDNFTPGDVAHIIAGCKSAHEMREKLFEAVHKRMDEVEKINALNKKLRSELRHQRALLNELSTHHPDYDAAAAHRDEITAQLAALLERRRQLATKLDNITIIVTLIA